ncbi:MAG: NADH:ubiquinone reductase (Na(+)-transporting) subunit B [Saprospiraceae bacterium]|nr:NADH:ubiquinone reductase (Na(+)-transporting) subunit B [Saprospiraceae bacterium]
MKFLENLVINKIRPNFEEGAKLEKLYPMYDALETFMFTPNHATRSGSHIRDAIDLKRTMMMVILALVPCLLFGMWNVGHWHFLAIDETVDFWEKMMYGAMKVLPIVLVSYAVGLGVEFIFCIIKKHAIQEGFLVSGMLIPLVMPPDIPLWMVAMATIFAVLIGKEVFGGTGMNILNIALTARAFIFFAYPKDISGFVWISGFNTESENLGFADGYTGASALGELANTVGQGMNNPEMTQYTQYFQSGQMYDIWNSFVGIIPGSIGETSVIACLIGAALLLFTGIASWRIMVSFFLGGLAMAGIFNAFAANEFMALEPLHQLVIGGFAFGGVFMATDPVTAAQTNTGKVIYGFLCGFLGIMIRVFNPAYPEGIMMAILFMNVMAPTIDHYVIQSNIKRREKRLKLKTA